MKTVSFDDLLVVYPCDGNPCVNGACTNIDDDEFECECVEGYTGVTCESGTKRMISCKHYDRSLLLYADNALISKYVSTPLQF